MQARVAGPATQLVLRDMSVMVKREWTMQLAFDAYSVAMVKGTGAGAGRHTIRAVAAVIPPASALNLIYFFCHLRTFADVVFRIAG